MKILSLVIAIAALAAPALAQQEPVPNNLLNPRRLLPDNTLSVCINANGLLAEFDRAVARALADRLLLDLRLYEAKTARDMLPLDYRLPFLWEDVYILMENECDAFMGVVAGGAGYPEWMALSRAYARTGFVLVTANPVLATLAEVPPNALVGVRMNSGADIAFRTYNDTLAAALRWRRSPYPYDKLLVDRLIDGTLTAAFVWEPTLSAATHGNPGGAGLKALDPGAFVHPPDLDFAIAFKSVDDYLRTSVDQAITALVEDGTIASLAEKAMLPIRPAIEE